MLVTKTPLRISLFGGGTDIPEFYEKHGGLVISAAIDSNIYIALNHCVAPHLKVVYSQLELENNVENIKHDRVREALKHFNISSNIELCSFSDMNTKGTGLGSSSTFTVGLVNGLYALKFNQELPKNQLAELASYIEIELCKEPIGKQDQYAATYGGTKIYRFNSTTVDVEEYPFSSEVTSLLFDNLFFYNTKISRDASSVLTEQVDNLKNNINIDYTKQLLAMAEDAIDYLKLKRLECVGSLLHDSWEIKKKLSSNVTNPVIDEMYDNGIKAGSIGGKLLGAGGGGYLMFYVAKSKQKEFLTTMEQYGYERTIFRPSYIGSKLYRNF